jgi:hypothetical protein
LEDFFLIFQIPYLLCHCDIYRVFFCGERGCGDIQTGAGLVWWYKGMTFSAESPKFKTSQNHFRLFSMLFPS